MATRRETLEPILDAIPGATARPMFGEYGLYLDGRIIALICDGTLFLKNLPEAASLLPGAELGLPYPGAKPCLIADPWLDDPDTLAEAARAIARVLPLPKPKAPKAKKAK
jgi:TfoX/Sxy family transcriptional regulator of competence genes